jgi:transcriptional regulator with XRE-family HTH domain
VKRREDLRPLADTLRATRKAAGHTQESFAYAADLDRGFVGAVERAERNVGYRKLRQLVAGLGISWRQFGAALHERDPLPERVRLDAPSQGASTEVRAWTSLDEDVALAVLHCYRARAEKTSKGSAALAAFDVAYGKRMGRAMLTVGTLRRFLEACGVGWAAFGADVDASIVESDDP